MRRMASHRSWSLAWAYAWDGICSTEEESREDLSLSLSARREYLDEKSPSSIQEGGTALERAMDFHGYDHVDGSHDNHGNIVENRDVGYKRNATDALRINFSCNP